ncbi:MULTISPECIES: hypothetical protein [Streptomyces]|uniref:hypothetical protein n=1 Tax=Streptomyces TaxID=1883 RepID=UPI00345BFE79
MAGVIDVEYNVFTIAGPDAQPGCMDRPYGNGLVAATARGRPAEEHTVAVVVTGTLDGDVWVTAETWGQEPPPLALDAWQDAAQITIEWPGGSARVLGADVDPLPQLTFGHDLPPGRRRLLVAGRNRDEGEARHADAPVEEYLLQMWPAASDSPSDDVILKTTSATGAMWQAACRLTT